MVIMITIIKPYVKVRDAGGFSLNGGMVNASMGTHGGATTKGKISKMKRR